MTTDLDLALVACGRILTKLKVVSDVSAVHVENVDYAHAKQERLSRTATPAQPLLNRRSQPNSKEPAGVNVHADMTGPERAPSKELSLYAHYQWRIQRAVVKARNAAGRDSTGEDVAYWTGQLLGLAAMANRDYLEMYHPKKVKHDETEKAAIERLLTEWVGCTSSETAAWFRTGNMSDRRRAVAVRLVPDRGPVWVRPHH